MPAGGSCEDAPVIPSVLETDRLRLRPFARDLSDVDALNAIQSDPVHMRYYPHPFSPEDTRAWIERWLRHEEEYGYALWAIEESQTGAFLGNCGPAHQVVDGKDELEIGWSVAPWRANQGIATEAAAAVRDHCFGIIGAPYVISLVRPENGPSARVAEKIGMGVWKETRFGSEGWIHRVYRVDRDGSAPA
jgi:RimJ/RimL family protein N-acetyltransferase